MHRVGAAIKANGTVLEYSLPANNVQLTTVGKFWAAVESTNSFNSDAPAAPPRVVGVVDGGGGSTFFDDIAGCAAVRSTVSFFSENLASVECISVTWPDCNERTFWRWHWQRNVHRNRRQCNSWTHDQCAI